MSWLTDRVYRRKITISRPAGAVTNYQMKLLVGESSGATGEAVDCGGHCLSNFNDLRFTNSSGTVLDYWIESISGTTPNQLATIWIEFNSIGTSDTTFYMYYGNPSSSAYSNGANTFLLFDDFTGEALDSDLWTSHYGVESIADSTLTVNAGGNGLVYSKDTFGQNTAIRSQANMMHTFATAGYYFGYINGVSVSAGVHLIEATGGGFVTLMGRNWINPYIPNYSWTETLCDSVGNRIYDIQRGITKSVFVVNDGTPVELATTIPTDDFNVELNRPNSAGKMTCDWILVRNYRDVEPTWGSWGDEEAATLEVAPAIITIKETYTKQYSAYFTGTQKTDVTASCAFTSSNTEAATISGTGLATGVSSGTAVITASYLGISDTATLYVREIHTTTTTPKLLLRWRDDGYPMWSDFVEIDLDPSYGGDFIAQLNRMGSYEARQYEFRMSDGVDMALINAVENVN